MNSPKKMSLIVFDDIFIIYDLFNDSIESKSILDFSQYLRNSNTSNTDLTLFMELPYVLIPEIMYEDGEGQLLINHKYPHILPGKRSIKTDTWPLHTTKCIYYIPQTLYGHRHQVYHLYSAFSKWSEDFFNKHSSGLWTFKIQNRLIAFLRLNSDLKEVRSFEVQGPDESSFQLLKLMESYKDFQYEITLFTNETDPYFLQIMSKYISRIEIEKRDENNLIKDILALSCASLQEI